MKAENENERKSTTSEMTERRKYLGKAGESWRESYAAINGSSFFEKWRFGEASKAAKAERNISSAIPKWRGWA